MAESNTRTPLPGIPSLHSTEETQSSCELDQTSHWAPLEKLFAPQHCANFMFMDRVHQGAITIYLYKHRQTRRYLNLDASGGAYQFAPNTTDRSSSYQSIPLVDALTHALT